EFIYRRWRRTINAECLNLVIAIDVDETNLHAGPDRAIDHANQHDHAAIRVVPRIEDQRFQRRVRIALWRGHVAHDRFENVSDTFAGLRAGEYRVVCFEPDE